MNTILSRATTLLAVSLALVMAGCGGGSKPAAPAPAPAATTPPSTTPATTTAASPGKRPDSDGNGVPDVITSKGRIGDTLALEGDGLGDDPNDHTKTKLSVTVKALSGPFTGYDLPAGRKLIGVEVSFANTGRLVYDDPRPQGKLTMTGGESGKQTSLIQLGGQNPCDDKSLKLKKGQSKGVCIAFDVPRNGKPQTFEYVTDSGYGDTGLWRLR
jgi:hypothetical protein